MVWVEADRGFYIKKEVCVERRDTLYKKRQKEGGKSKADSRRLVGYF